MTPPTPTARERVTSVALFFATFTSVFLVYGYQWTSGDPLRDPAIAWESLRFAAALMGILLAHEMGHYLVARRHGFELSLPYFLPLPTAFGTFGAIIRLKSLPSSRSALLEMGAAGPLAGFAVALAALALGLPATVEHLQPEVVWAPPPELVVAAEPGVILRALDQILQLPPFTWLLSVPPVGTLPMLILANPLALDLLGHLVLGAAPGKFAVLGPVATAGWVGCLLTGINLVPIGQLDGGHILSALAPRLAPRVSRIGVGVALLAGLAWSGWAVWGVMLLVLRAWVSLPVPVHPAPTKRAYLVAVCAGIAFVLSFMPRPLVVEEVAWDQIHWVDASGATVPTPPLPPGDPDASRVQQGAP